MSTEEPLAWKDTFVTALVQSLITQDCTTPPLTINPTGDNYITIRVTENELTKLLSATEQGAYLIYGDEAHQVMWSLLEGIECNLLCEAICEVCLKDPVFLQCLADALLGMGFGSGTGTISGEPIDTIQDQVIADLGPGCTDDDRYGLCWALVDEMNEKAVDMLDVVRAIASIVELAAELSDNAGAFTFLASSTLDAAKYMFDTVVNEYETAYTTAIQEEVACNIFKELCGECQLTLQMIIDGYERAFTALIPPLQSAGFVEIATWLASLPVQVDVATVSIYQWLIAKVWTFGSDWLNSTARTIEIAVSAAAPLSPPVGCECIDPTWTHVFDFTVDDGGWENRADDTRPYGVWESGVGWKSVFAGAGQGLNNDERLYMQKDGWPSRVVTQVQLFYTTTGSQGGAGRESTIALFLATVQQATENFGAFNVPDTWFEEWNGSETIDEINTVMVGDITSDVSEFVLTKAVVRGVGTDPF